MSRTLSSLHIGLLLGLVVGITAGWGISRIGATDVDISDSQLVVPSPSHSEVAATVSVDPEKVCEPKLASLRARIEQLERSLLDPTPVAVEAAEAPEQGERTPTIDRTKWRISAIEKFVPLDDAQRDRLAAKFHAEASQNEREGEDIESLEDILGAENARFYRKQVSDAFRKAKEEEVDREVVWLSRQLDLTADQERRARDAFAAIEQEIAGQDGSANSGAGHMPSGNAAARIQSMVEENRRRSQLRIERLKEILTDDQLRAFIRVESESSSADLEVFHDPGASSK